MAFEEHEKRAWSVDFAPTQPTCLASGSDDSKGIQKCLPQQQDLALYSSSFSLSKNMVMQPRALSGDY